MSSRENQNEPPQLVEPVVRPGRSIRWSWVWLVPLLALVVAATLLGSVWVRTGPTITISFESASGIEAGQAKLRYRNVVVGEVSSVRVAPDRQKVLVDVQLKRDGAEFITQKASKFWVVSSQVSLAGVSGLDTLLSGSYISVDAPISAVEGAPVYEFQGLTNPPEIFSGQVGSRYVLTSSSLGSLRVGSGVYYRRIEVGRVVAYEMTPDGRGVELHVFIEAPYDKFITLDTRFWNDSGIDLSVGTDGVNLRTSGLAALVDGGIAFAQADETTTFEGEVDGAQAPSGSAYVLFDSRDKALADPDGPPAPIEMRFNQSIRGLRVGADIDYRGMVIGKVVDIDLEFDGQSKRFYSRVRGLLYPMRFSDAYRDLVAAAGGISGHDLLDPLVKHGLRAQLRSASLLTGQQYVALVFLPGEKYPPEVIGEDPPQGYLLPTVQGDFDRLQNQVGNIVTKIEALPLDDIGQKIQSGLGALNNLLAKLDSKLAPQASTAISAASKALDRIAGLLEPEAPLMSGVQDTMLELMRTARSLRQLADNLQAHPESLLRGQPTDRDIFGGGK